MKNLAFFLLFVVLFTSCKSTSTASRSSSKKDATAMLAEKIVNTASENIGVRYKAAGTTKSGYDCSGLVYTTFGQYDIQLPRTSIEQSKTGIDLGQNISKAQKADLIFFKTNRSSQINHVGIVTEISNDEIKFIHTSTSKGVMISSTKELYYQKAFAQLNRILE